MANKDVKKEDKKPVAVVATPATTTAKKPAKKEAAAPASEKDNIRTCGCVNEYQDKKYGKGMRVHTPGKRAPGGSRNFFCTVCGAKK